MKYNDIILNVIVIVTLIFLLVNFDFQVPATYLFFAFISLILFFFDKHVSFVTEHEGSNRWLEIAYAVVAYVIFNFIASISLSISGYLSTVTGTSFSLFNDTLFQTFSNATPALANVIAISILVWGILIAIIETDFFFGRMFEFITDTLHINVSLRNIKTWAVIILVSAAFMLFHITAKGITNNSALLLVLLFGILSQVMVIYFGQTIEAKILHIIANTTAVIIGAGVSLFNVGILLVLGIPLAIHLLPEFKLFKIPRLTI